MKSVNVDISDEAYKKIFTYKIDNHLKTLGEAIDKLILDCEEDGKV